MDGASLPEPRFSELGDFLRSRRHRLAPDAGSGRRRRTPGLRREEVAERAGIGVDWYIRLEQGRSATPSAATVDALARALRLDRAEHAHLRTLAQGGRRRVFEREVVPPTLRRLVESLSQPAYVIGQRWDVLAWNAAACEVFTDFSLVPESERNMLLYVLTAPNARRLFREGWAELAQRMVAQFRAVYDLWAADPAFRDLHARLSRGSAEFGAWWDTHDIRAGSAGAKKLTHPTFGVIQFEYATFQSNDDPALRLALYVPA